MTDLVADIAVGVSVNRTFHYLVPEELRGLLAPGSRVLVPFGSRSMTGTVVGFPEKADVAGLKCVLGIEGGDLAADLLSLARWMSEYYLYPLGQTIEAVVPKALSRAKPRKKIYIRLLKDLLPGHVRGKKQAAIIELLSSRREIERGELDGFSSAPIKALLDAGI